MAEPKYRFQENLTKLSVEKTDFKKAIGEWQHVDKIKLKRGEHLCICSNKNVMYFHLFFNIKNSNMIYTGKECAKHLGLIIGQGGRINADFRQFIIMNPAIYTSLNDLMYSYNVRIKYIEIIRKQIESMPDLYKAFKRIQDLVNIFKSHNYTFVELESLCESILEKIQKKELEEREALERLAALERERIYREQLEKEHREKAAAIEKQRLAIEFEKNREEYERVKEIKRAIYEKRVERHKKRRESECLRQLKMEETVTNAFKDGDTDTIMKLMFGILST